MSNFHNLSTTQKGEFGETIIYPYLRSRGWIIYPHEEADKSHPCDGFMTRITKEKGVEIQAFEIKSRPKMNKYDAQGLDFNKLESYEDVYKKMEIVFFFIDENSKEILCTTFTKMNEIHTQIENSGSIYAYPNDSILFAQKIKLYTTRTMKCIGYITDEQQTFLKTLTNRNYKYQQ